MPIEQAPAASSIALRVATWNIHAGVGSDARYDPLRTLDVLLGLNADIIALQEVAQLSHQGEFLTRLRDALHVEIVTGCTRQHAGADYGNALLSRFPVSVDARLDLSVRRHEPRGAIDAVVDVKGTPLRVLSAHLGLRPSERRIQVRRLLRAIDRGAPRPVVLMGDVNEWFLWGRPARWLHADFHARPAPRTFPAQWPLFALDRIWVRPVEYLRCVTVHRTALARIASDHLPVTADLEIPCELPPRALGAGKTAQSEAVGST